MGRLQIWPLPVAFPRYLVLAFCLVCLSCLVPFELYLLKMSVIENLESGILPSELREVLRTLLSQCDQPFIDIPGTDGPGICISTSLADFRRHIEGEYRARLDSRPRVPASYTVNGRRKLPDSSGRPLRRDIATQTESETPTYMVEIRHRPGTPIGTAHIESAPEAGTYRRKGGRRPCVSRAICSSSSETDRVALTKSPRRSRPNQGWHPLSNVYDYAKDVSVQLPPLHLVLVRSRR
jgi:hypothetical protein